MINYIQKIIQNDTMYYVVVPILVVFLGWAKSTYDVKTKNKSMGYWKIKFRREYSFLDTSMNIYKYMLIVLAVSVIGKAILLNWIDKSVAYLITGSFNLLADFIVFWVVNKDAKVKNDFLTDGKKKRQLLIFLHLIFCFGFFGDLLKNIGIIIFALALCLWVFLMYRCTDLVFVLDKSFADIYINGCKAAEFVSAGSIRKKGEWLFVDRYINGYDEEIRIKESDITRIDYFGEPIFIVEKMSFFKK